MFVDHYLDVEYDLSQVFFVATANVLHTIPPALQDRMEVIRLSGYTELEKLEIAKRFLVKKQMEATGLDDKQIEFTEEGLASLVQYYTRESGVRNLEREIGNVARKITRKFVSKDIKEKVVINAARVTDLSDPTNSRHHHRAQEPDRLHHGPGLDRSRRPDPHYGMHPDGRQRQADRHR